MGPRTYLGDLGDKSYSIITGTLRLGPAPLSIGLINCLDHLHGSGTGCCRSAQWFVWCWGLFTAPLNICGCS